MMSRFYLHKSVSKYEVKTWNTLDRATNICSFNVLQSQIKVYRQHVLMFATKMCLLPKSKLYIATTI